MNLLFTSDDQGIYNLSLLSPLVKIHHNVIIFQYQLECVESSKVGYNYHTANYTSMKKKNSIILSGRNYFKEKMLTYLGKHF